MPDGRITALTDLETAEVSIVDRGANKKRFAITKAQPRPQQPRQGNTDMEKNIEILKAVLDVPADGEASIGAEYEGKISEKGIAAAVALLRLLRGFADELPQDALKYLAKMTDQEAPEDKPAAPAEGEEENDEMDEEKIKASLKKSDGPSLDGLSPEMAAQVEHLWKANREAVAKAEELTKALGVEREMRIRKEWVEKARAIGPVPGKTADQIGEMLFKASRTDPEMASSLEETFRQTAAVVEKSALFAEIGTARMDRGGDAVSKVEKMAQGLVEKSATPLTKEQAIVKVLETNPGLYDEYIAECSK